jgi:hypothetical protein
MWKEVVMAKCKSVFWHLPRGTTESKNIIEGNQSSGQGLSIGSPQYETNASYWPVTYSLNWGLNLWFHVADILMYLAQTLPVEDVCRVLPPGGDNLYHSYVQICQQVGHANHIKALIMATGQQLLTTLNLWAAYQGNKSIPQTHHYSDWMWWGSTRGRAETLSLPLHPHWL